MTAEITTRRQPSGIYLLLKDGAVVGEAWRMRVGSGFGVSLRGVYWRRGGEYFPDTVPRRTDHAVGH